MFVRPGYDARRRNRHWGTAARGHGSDNKLVIPAIRGERGAIDWRSWPGVAVQQVGAHRTVCREIVGKRWTFVVERTYPSFWHACSVDDVARVLSLIPAGDHEGLDIVILHQPTRKYRLLNGAWGQLCYWVEIGRHEGAAVVLPAFPASESWYWRRGVGVTPDDLQELERLRQDGHEVTRRGRKLTIQVTRQTVRNTQLYRTLPHEIGHWADFLERVKRDDHSERPTREREHAAHRYADAICARLVRDGGIPFPQMIDRESLRTDQPDPDDFIPPDLTAGH
jgi:hypothetical protein